MTLLSEAADAFLDERLGLGQSKPYLRMIKRVLWRLAHAMETRTGEPPLATCLSRRDVAAVLDDVVARGLSSQSLVQTTAVLRGFCRWLVRKGLLLVDPSQDFQVKRARPRASYVPSPEEVKRLLHEAGPDRALERLRPLRHDARRRDHEKRARRLVRVSALALRDVALLELLYGSGLRISEAVKLDVTDLDLAERAAFLKEAKGKKDRVVPLTAACLSALSRYLDQARPFLQKAVTPALLLMGNGSRLSAKSWEEYTLVPLLKSAGLPRALTPHRLRHACAVHLLESGADLISIARLLGHESVETTVIYLALSPAALAKTLLLCHPRERDAEQGSRGPRRNELRSLR